MSAGGTFPGYELLGRNLPLNCDWLLMACLEHPGLPGLPGSFGEFMGVLDQKGCAKVKLGMPPDEFQLLGVPINFAYVLLNEGGTEVTLVSNPVHIKYIPQE